MWLFAFSKEVIYHFKGYFKEYPFYNYPSNSMLDNLLTGDEETWGKIYLILLKDGETCEKRRSAGECVSKKLKNRKKQKAFRALIIRKEGLFATHSKYCRQDGQRVSLNLPDEIVWTELVYVLNSIFIYFRLPSWKFGKSYQIQG